MSIDEYAEVSFTITNEIMDAWEIGKRELCTLATINTPKILPLNLTSLNALRFQVKVTQFEKVSDTINNLPYDFVYAITNEFSRNGFSAIFYPDVLRWLGKRFGNFYLLPSSIHEALLVPEDCELPPKQLLEMVKAVNTEIITADEYLSDSIYQYSVEKDKLHAYFNTCLTEE